MSVSAPCSVLVTSTSGERSKQRVLSVCLSSLGRNEGIVKQRPKKKKIVKKISREVEFKSGRQCGPRFYSLQLASLDRLLDLKTRSGGGPVTTILIQLTELLVRMEKSLELLESSRAPPSLVSHWRGQLLR